MIPVLIEPTYFSFDLYKRYALDQMDNKSEELIEFRNFYERLKRLFEEMENFKLGVAVTQELSDIYKAGVPVFLHQDSHPFFKQAKDLFYRKLSRLSVVIHQYGSHGIEIDFDDVSLKKDSLLHKEESYLHWKDMSFSSQEGKVPEVVLVNPTLSIFDRGKITFINGKSERLYSLDSFHTLNNLIEQKSVCLFVINNSIQNNRNALVNVRCSGTGDHSSMWGDSIKTLNDIPAFERKLFERLISTGLIKSIKLLSFDKRYPSVESPSIELNSIQTYQQSDILAGVIRGRGKKQHAQNIQIETVLGVGHLLMNAFEGEINLGKLELIHSAVAATRETY